MPDASGGYASALGGLMAIAGTAILSSGADERRQQAIDLANTPGLDFGGITRDALLGYNANLPAATALSGQLSQSNQAQLMAREEQALPGIGAARANALGSINSLFDQNNAAWLAGVQRRGAALGLSSGLMGSGAGQLQTLRLSDQEQMQRTQLGTGLLGSLIGSMRLANTPGVQTFLGPTIQEQVAQRGQERTQRLNMLSSAYGLPTGLEVWGNELNQAGHALAGAGAAGNPAQPYPNYNGGMNGGYGGWNGGLYGQTADASQFSAGDFM